MYEAGLNLLQGLAGAALIAFVVHQVFEFARYKKLTSIIQRFALKRGIKYRDALDSPNHFPDLTKFIADYYSEERWENRLSDLIGALLVLWLAIGGLAQLFIIALALQDAAQSITYNAENMRLILPAVTFLFYVLAAPAVVVSYLLTARLPGDAWRERRVERYELRHGLLPTSYSNNEEPKEAERDTSKDEQEPPFSRLMHAITAATTTSILEAKDALADGASPNARNNEGLTPVMVLARNYTSVLSERLNFHISEAPSDLVPTAKLAKNDINDLLTTMLEGGGDPNAEDHHGWTPLTYAAAYADGSFIELLLDYGADPTVRDVDGRRPADIAKEYNNRVFLGDKTLARIDV